MVADSQQCRARPTLVLFQSADYGLCNERCLRGSKKQRYDDGGRNSKPPRAVVIHWDWVIRSFLPRLVVRGCEKHNPISEIVQTD
jgi:hypothetical protein